MMKFRLERYTTKISVDLGTANTLVVSSSGEILLSEPSVVAIKSHHAGHDAYVCAVGKEAKLMIGRTPVGIEAKRPLQHGVIADFQVTEAMLQHFLKQVLPTSFPARLFRPEVIICVPHGSTQVERRAIRESALGAGAGYVYLIDEPMAAAIGANLPVESAHGSMIVDIGGGTTEVAIISLNGIVYAQSIRVGGDRFDESIISYVRRNYGCLIGHVTAEKIKQQIGIAFPTDDIKELQVSGRHVAEGVPRSFSLSSNDVLEALQEPLSGIVNAVRSALEQAPPELSSDIEERGLVLSGGGALLTGIDLLIAEETGLPVIIAEDPLTCVGRGGAKIIETLAHSSDRHLVEEE
ncbi:rod shape-determining protein [Candidatus Comchoanobacter bicostacola]|uniref:Cell shape-determining protein MreB n=1 Tax=Candidatus Comchoanobacter bicostacola TaxID=2919598 RepID=A0ABY5DJY8_9GAMM|nr:rod shape-determining protein [Candidatus Comchoanobacter bicostacola]UTC24142.1 rod shape-determining protein [Candidatus Comchoanobacter bicostacola]